MNAAKPIQDESAAKSALCKKDTSHLYFELDLPVAPAIMVEDELVPLDVATSEIEMEKYISRM